MFGSEQQEALERRTVEWRRGSDADRAGRRRAAVARRHNPAGGPYRAGRSRRRGPGSQGRIDTLYRARVTGFVAVYFVTGRTAEVQLLAGPSNPPMRVVGVVDARGSQNSYAGGIVRTGEYWTAASTSKRPNLNFRVHFTPLF